jgi:hypothetical protein
MPRQKVNAQRSIPARSGSPVASALATRTASVNRCTSTLSGRASST